MALILVIDDDDLVSRTLQRALKHYEYQVMTANSGIEGLQLARRHRPDLFILDIMMPGVDGYQVCRQIRGDPLLQDAPVLFLTAKAKDEDKIEGFRAGGDDYLVKPFNMQDLELRVKAILRRAGPEKVEETSINEGRPRAAPADRHSASGPAGGTPRAAPMRRCPRSGKPARRWPRS